MNMENQCEKLDYEGNNGETCSAYYNCCDCGITDGEGCGCAYCWSCNACDFCLNDDTE